MSVCVLDASFTFQWLFKDEASPEGDAALKLISAEGAVVPALWFVEIVNGLGMAERRGRLAPVTLGDAIDLLRSLRLAVDEVPTLQRSQAMLDLMRLHHLTAYDATYLELAMRRGLPLATHDKELRKAATGAGVGLLNAAVC